MRPNKTIREDNMIFLDVPCRPQTYLISVFAGSLLDNVNWNSK